MSAFPGDIFRLDKLKLSRPAIGYGIQQLGTDQLLSPVTASLIPIRKISADDIFSDFESAAQYGARWLEDTPHTPLALVPIGYDALNQRFTLIQGVIKPHP